MSRFTRPEGFFTDEDFPTLAYWDHGAIQKSFCYDAARIANAIIREELEKGIPVKGRPVPTGERMRWSEYRFPETTHQGVVVAIEEVKK